MSESETFREFYGRAHLTTGKPMLIRVSGLPEGDLPSPKWIPVDPPKEIPKFKKEAKEFQIYGLYKDALELYELWLPLQVGTSFQQWLRDCAWVHRRPKTSTE